MLSSRSSPTGMLPMVDSRCPRLRPAASRCRSPHGDRTRGAGALAYALSARVNVPGGPRSPPSRALPTGSAHRRPSGWDELPSGRASAIDQSRLGRIAMLCRTNHAARSMRIPAYPRRSSSSSKYAHTQYCQCRLRDYDIHTTVVRFISTFRQRWKKVIPRERGAAKPLRNSSVEV
jgi:hypothetical protein